MPSKVRPACPQCGAKMAPLYRKGTRGKAFVKAPPFFICCGTVASGRRKPRFLEA